KRFAVRPRMLNGFAIRHPAPLVDRSSAPSIPSRLPLSMLGHGRASSRGMARPRPFRCLFQFRNSFLLSHASGGEERTYTTKHGPAWELRRTVIPLARSFEGGRKTGVTAPREAFAPWHRSRPPSLDRRAVTRHHQTAASPVSRSVQGFKRDDDVRRFRLVKLETRRVVVAPAGKIHDLGRLSRRPGGSLGRLHSGESVAVEEERVFSEQVVELWNHGVVVGNGPGFELPQSALDLCGREFHCTLPSIGSLQGDEPRDIALCAASHLRWSNR